MDGLTCFIKYADDDHDDDDDGIELHLIFVTKVLTRFQHSLRNKE